MASPEPELRPESETFALDWNALARRLRTHGLDYDPAGRGRQFAGGLGNLNFLIQVDGRATVLRRPPPGPLPPGANDMAREHRVLSRLPAAFPLAPRAVHLCDDPAVLGAPFVLMEYRPGTVIRDALPADFAPHASALGALLVGVLAALHAVDPEAVGLGDLGRPEGFLLRTARGWARRAAVATGGAPPDSVADLLRWLEAQPAPPATAALLHNDFKLDNVVLPPAPSDPDTRVRPLAVLDWDMCTRGDPLLDLAVLLSYWTEAGDPEPLQRLRQMPSAAPGFPTREEAAVRYAKLTGRGLDGFRFHRVLALLRLGVVFLQLHARHVRGETRDPRFAEFGAVGEGVLEVAAEVAAGRRF